MDAPALRCLLAAALVAIATPSAAGPATGACTPPAARDALTDRAATLAEFERQPRHCLEAMVRQCTAAADAALLDPGTAAGCSYGYEALLKKGFGGNFQAMLAWWRSEQVAGN